MMFWWVTESNSIGLYCVGDLGDHPDRERYPTVDRSRSILITYGFWGRAFTHVVCTPIQTLFKIYVCM